MCLNVSQVDITVSVESTMSTDLSETQERAADLLGRGRTRKDVAQLLGIGASTISRWRADPVFQAAEERATHEHRDHPTARSTLEDLLDARLPDGSPDNKIRFMAAVKLLDIGLEKPEDDGPAPGTVEYL